VTTEAGEADLAPRECRVVLVGMMGSGKSTVGRLLAQRTGWPRYDNDALLQELFGMTAKQIVEERGEEEKREAENAALAFGLTRPAPCILDAAGGTITSVASRTALKPAIVVWLRARPKTLYRRAVGGAHRPFMDGGEEWVRKTDAERRPLYASVADITMDTDKRRPSAIVDEVMTRLRTVCPEISG
jgi:shikimate kinase